LPLLGLNDPRRARECPWHAETPTEVFNGVRSTNLSRWCIYLRSPRILVTPQASVKAKLRACVISADARATWRNPLRTKASPMRQLLRRTPSAPCSDRWSRLHSN